MGAAAPLPRVGSAVIVRKDGKFLLGIRDKEPNRGKWVFPGGKVNPFEDIEEAAARELREETGLEIEIEGPIGIYQIIDRPKEHRIIFLSWGTIKGGDLRPSSDISKLQFFSKHELPDLDTAESVRKVLQAFDEMEKHSSLLPMLRNYIKRTWFGAWRNTSEKKLALIRS